MMGKDPKDREGGYLEPSDVLLEVELRAARLAAYCQQHGVSFTFLVAHYDPLDRTEALGFALGGPVTSLRGLLLEGEELLADMTSTGQYDACRWRCLYGTTPKDPWPNDADDDDGDDGERLQQPTQPRTPGTRCSR